MGILFLFGAGASFGSGPCQPSNPPLGKDLLLRMRDEGGIASTIEGDLLDCFITDPEKGMVRFFEERNGDTTELLKQMCAYLAQFRIENGNNYLKLLSLLKSRKICFATTNYDLLIEQAICSLGHSIQYSSAERIKNQIPLLKIHGSANFIPRANIYGIRFEMLGDRTNAAISDAPIDFYDNANDIIKYCKSDTALSPAVALYHPEKKVLHCPSVVARQQADFKLEVERSTKIFIIGLKINPDDKHIWSEIEKTQADVYIVDKDKASTTAWINSIRKKNIYHIADTFDESIMKIKNLLQL
ncbi:SIR2 family protein [Enterobacter hormaechei]|uniref:SIR2 family protein n=1 Tax=Enterobacter hormaechei TaxID=158836 RepID=UPI00396AE5F3